jgi:imidazole glycerol-phosphate synthase subunit HisF
LGLAKRIIPTLLYRGDQLVKGKQFNSWRSVGHVLQAARVYAARGVDELVVLDIAATPAGRGPDFKLVEKITAPSFTPITVGGGVRTVTDVRDLLNAGADKVAVCSSAFTRYVVAEATAKFGRQAVVGAIDVKAGAPHARCGTVAKDLAGSPVEWAKWLEAFGAGEILLTSIDREGTLAGYDLPTVRDVCSAVSVPVVAHGGCGTYEHMREAIAAGASAAAAGAMFQFTDATPKGAAQYLAARGVETRL